MIRVSRGLLEMQSKHPFEVKETSVAERCTRGLNSDAEGEVNSLDGWKL